MLLRQIRDVLGATVLCGETDLDWDAHSACASDLMSDVLAFVKDQAVLLTGMVNPQVIRTAEMMDIKCVVFVRGKSPDAQIIQMAKDREMVIMSAPHRMFVACGLLHSNGLVGE